MISRIAMLCVACQHEITARIQVGHETDQLISSVCPDCYTPFRLRLLLDQPPEVRVEFHENCRERSHEGPAGTVVNIGSGFVISRSMRSEEKYFPSFDIPEPTPAEVAEVVERVPGPLPRPLMLDKMMLLGGLPRAKEVWRQVRTAYRFHRTDQHERANAVLRELLGDGFPDEEITIGQGLLSFIARILKPYGSVDIDALVSEASKIKSDQREMHRLIEDFGQLKWERMDDKIEVLDHFFRAYDEFNQVFMYVRRKVDMPEDPFAPSTDFEHTRMYYGEAFEVLGAHIDILAASNNIIAGRPYDELASITLRKYRSADKGKRKETVAANPTLASIVDEYDNQLRNATHHRWVRLSHDRSVLRYRRGGNGDLVSLSYAEYLWRCCRITRQLMLLLALELIILSQIDLG